MTMPYWKYRPYETVSLPDRTWPDVVLTQAPIWCSTDLRDGNQALVNPMDTARKRRFFDLLVQLGIKEIEVGFPSASKTDFDFARTLVEEGLIPERHDDRGADAGAAGADRAHVRGDRRARRARSCTSTTRPRRRSGASCSGSDEAGITDLAVKGTELCKRARGADGDRDRLPVLARELPPHRARLRARGVRGGRRRVGADAGEKPMIVNLPTTVESFPPNVYADRMEWFIRNFSRRDAAIISVHPHNDRGTAVATAELGLMAGADRVEGCLFGNGERTGNVDIVTIALNLLTQGVDPEHGPVADRRDEAHRRGVQRAAGAPAAPVGRRPRLHGVLRLAPGCDQEGHVRAGALGLGRLGRAVPADRPEGHRPHATRRSSASTRSRARAASRT